MQVRTYNSTKEIVFAQWLPYGYSIATYTCTLDFTNELVTYIWS